MKFLNNLIDFLNTIKDKLPIQGRVERWKNEVDDLNQRQAFIKIHLRNDLADEYDRNAKRLQHLNQLLKNKATD